MIELHATVPSSILFKGGRTSSHFCFKELSSRVNKLHTTILRLGYLLIGDRHTGAIESHDWEKMEEDDSGEAPVSTDEIRLLVALEAA